MEVDEVVSQFGCMQTHDQDDLVNQMLRLVGANMNMSAARFYLEMNQWNVQAAVCSYFDLESANSNLPGMVFLADITIGEGESVPPNTPFVKTWRVENPGPDPWPPGVILRWWWCVDPPITFSKGFPLGHSLPWLIECWLAVLLRTLRQVVKAK